MKRNITVKEYNGTFFLKMKEGCRITGAWSCHSNEDCMLFINYFLKGYDLKIDIYGNLKTTRDEMMKAIEK